MSGRFKLSIREILGIVAICAFTLALILVSRQNSDLKNQIVMMSTDPYLRVHSDSPVRQKYDVNSGIGVTGKIHPLNYSFSADPRIVVRLIEIESQQTIVETIADIGSKPNGKGFSCNIKPPAPLSTAFYAIEFTLFDGDEELAEHSIVRHVVDAAYVKERWGE